MQWGSNLKSKLTVNYQAVGSGAGVAAFAAGTADWAASDPSLLPADKATLKKGPVLQIPTVFGAITVSYNLPGVKSGLKLDGPTIADIFIGKVTTWNNKEIAKLNPGVKLPNTAIAIVHRSDSSGTTKGFTTFLSDYSAQWKSKIGADKVVQWPKGTGAMGNSGVAGVIKQKKGAIGYVESAYALQNGFTFAAVKNAKGVFITPTLPSTTAAGLGLKIPADLGISAINAPNAKAYPIVSQTFIDAYEDLCKGGMSSDQAHAFGTFMAYALNGGQGVAEQLKYAGLPPGLLKFAKAKARLFKCNGASVGA
jgi:phosphate transport system substrate-binding protein